MQQKVALKPSPSPSQLQRVAITPRMIGVLRAAQHSLPQLIGNIRNELASNPFLKEDGHYELPIDLSDAEVGRETIVEGIYDREQPQKTSVASIIERTTKAPKNLSQDLFSQLRLVYKESSLEFQIGEVIVGSLDERGYFQEAKVDEIADALKTDAEKVREVLGVVQGFSPYGVAATSVQGCLLAQLRHLRRRTAPIEAAMVRDHFSRLRRKQFALIAERTGYDIEAVRRAAKNIALLEPYPARALGREETQYIVPDVYVYERGGLLRVRYNHEALPRVGYSNEFKTYASQSMNDELRDYLRQKSEQAATLMSGLEYRETHLMKVVRHLIRVQESFFRRGYAHLEPYTLTQLSEALRINPGTLSRLVNNKFVQTKWGLFGLRVFFSTALKRQHDSVSSTKVKNLIALMLREHSGGKRLSDLQITKILRQKGYSIARRTVAKYRNHLQIPSSFYR